MLDRNLGLPEAVHRRPSRRATLPALALAALLAAGSTAPAPAAAETKTPNAEKAKTSERADARKWQRAPRSESASPRHYRPYRRYYGHFGYGPFYAPYYRFGYGPYYAPYYYPYGGVVVGGYGPGSSRAGRDYGALDLDLKPGRTEIYVDGNRVGTADDFDGFPTYLWLAKGTYDLDFYLDGYETLSRQYTIYPGLVIDVDDALVPGTAVRPEDRKSRSTEVRDERLRRDRERAEVGRRDAARASTGRLVFEIAPADAAVYLDGEFVGTAEELAHLRSGLILEAGEHEVEVVRPGYGVRREAVEILEGERVEVHLQLDRR